MIKKIYFSLDERTSRKKIEQILTISSIIMIKFIISILMKLIEIKKIFRK